MHAALAHIRAQLVAALDELDELERSVAHVPLLSRHSDAITANVPPGFDTVLGYLAKHHPDILDEVDYGDPSVTQRDGFWCMHQAKRRGRKPVTVDAPPALRRIGIPHVNAWPVEILRHRWG